MDSEQEKQEEVEKSKVVQNNKGYKGNSCSEMTINGECIESGERENDEISISVYDGETVEERRGKGVEGTDEDIKEEVSQMYQNVLDQIGHNSVLIDDTIRSLQAENSSFRNENALLKDRVKILERKMELITQDLISTKRNTFSNDQYLRQHNLEIEGIPTIDDDKNLESTVTAILKQIDVVVTPDKFEACHRLMTSRGGKHDFPGTTICRFTNQRICESIHRNKAKLKELKENDFYSKIIINENINLYFKDLFSKCSILKSKEKIEDAWAFKGIPIIKLKNKDVKHITHPYDLERLFPGFNYSYNEQNQD